MENPAGIAAFSVIKKLLPGVMSVSPGRSFLLLSGSVYIRYQDIVQDQVALETEREQEPVPVPELWDDVCQTKVFPGREVEPAAHPYSGRDGAARLRLCWLR